MDHGVPVDSQEYLRQIDIEGEVMPDEAGVHTGKGKSVSLLDDSNRVLTNNALPCSPLPLPAKDLTAREGEIEVEGLVLCENNGWHSGADPRSHAICGDISMPDREGWETADTSYFIPQVFFMTAC